MLGGSELCRAARLTAPPPAAGQPRADEDRHLSHLKMVREWRAARTHLSPSVHLPSASPCRARLPCTVHSALCTTRVVAGLPRWARRALAPLLISYAANLACRRSAWTACESSSRRIPGRQRRRAGRRPMSSSIKTRTLTAREVCACSHPTPCIAAVPFRLRACTLHLASACLLTCTLLLRPPAPAHDDPCLCAPLAAHAGLDRPR